MIPLMTERTILRAFQERDAADVFAYARNPKIGPSAGWKPHESIEESKRVIQQFIAQNEVWAIEKKTNQTVIGSVGLHRDDQRRNDKVRMIGYVLSEPYWGQGLMTEVVRRVISYAFEIMGLDLISVYHFPFNLQSKRVIEKCGFQYEGELRLATRIYSGAVYSDVCYSMTREEYAALASR